METLTAGDPDFGSVVVNHIPACVVLTHPDGREESVATRLFLPQTVGGVGVMDLAWDMVNCSLENAEDETSRRRLQEVATLLWLHFMAPPLDPRRRRRFDPRSFERSASLVELTRLTKTRYSSLHERVLAAAGDVPDLPDLLLSRAIYERPVIRLPFDESTYQQFREMYLGEIADMVADLEDLADAALKSARRDARLEKDSEVRRRMLAAVERARRGEWSPAVHRGLMKCARLVFRTATRMERENAERFTDLVARFDALYDRFVQEARLRGVAELSGEGQSVSPLFVAYLREVATTDADELLDAFIERYQSHYDLSPAEFITEEDLAAFPAADPQVEPVEESDIPRLPAHQAYHASLGIARSSDDGYEKVAVLAQVRDQLVNRTECVRLVQREAEATYHQAAGQAYRFVYRAIRPYLSRAERRLFRLQWLPQRFLGGRVAMLDPVIRSFVLDMDEDTETLALLVAVKYGDSDTRGELREMLNRRWRAFLRLYPFWVDAVRHDERERRLRTTAPRTVSLEDPVPGPHGGPSVERKALHPDPKAPRPDADQTLAAVVGERLPALAKRYCPKQADAVVGYFLDGKTEVELAAQLRVTQQAVSKRLKTGVAKLRAGLRRDGMMPADGLA